MKIKDFTTGVQHIGIPTNDINKTIEFYHALGFETALRTVNGTEEVAFLQLLGRTLLDRWLLPFYHPVSREDIFPVSS